MKLVAMIIAGGLIATGASAQSNSSSTTPATAATPAPDAMVAKPGMATTTSKVVDPNAAMAPASGDANQAATTTAANAVQPVKGANSFTQGEAQRRIEAEGFSTVADLHKDDDGIWRGHASKSNATVGVWLDYKGNIGQQ